MRKHRIIALAFMSLLCLAAPSAANAQDISLPAPQKSTVEGSLTRALQDRQSSRSFTDMKISRQMLSDLLWAADGINRPDGKRTVPSAMNRQDITVYVGTDEGTFRYDAKENKLVKIGSGDLRKAVAGRNTFIRTAPVVLAIASDTSAFKGNIALSGIDAGVVVQNVYLFCAANGLGTVCCYAGEDTSEVQKFLGIKSENKPLVYMPVGGKQ